jgi:hypothetical protein
MERTKKRVALDNSSSENRGQENDVKAAAIFACRVIDNTDRAKHAMD